MSVHEIICRGTPSAGMRTLIGNLLYKCNGVDPETLEHLERQGRTTYDKVMTALHELHKPISFYTPKHHVNIVFDDSAKSKCTMVIGTIKDDPDKLADQISESQNVLTIINKMDLVNWTQTDLLAFTNQVNSKLVARGVRQASTFYVPTDALQGDNLIVPSSKSPCLVALSTSDTIQSQALSLVECLDKILTAL